MPLPAHVVSTFRYASEVVPLAEAKTRSREVASGRMHEIAPRSPSGNIEACALVRLIVRARRRIRAQCLAVTQ